MPDAAMLQGRRVLIVEDEYMIASQLARALQKLGAGVVGPVASVDQALKLIGEGAAIDAAVLDINLNGEQVYPVAAALRARDVPFVFATGYDDVSPHYSGAPRVEKPIDTETIVSLLFGR